MRNQSTVAIVLRTRDYAESDKVVTLLSRDAGKFGGIAKGAKRSQRRFAGALNLFTQVRVDYRWRPGAELAFLERATVVRPWRRILDSLERYTAASHVIELADKMTAEREVGDELYSLVTATLARIDAAEPGRATLRLFELASLVACGYQPNLVRCRSCRRPLAESPGPFRIAPDGASCRACADRDGGGVLVSAAVVANLDWMQRMVVDALTTRASQEATPLSTLYAGEALIEDQLSAPIARELASAIDVLLRPHVRGRLRTLDLLGPILAER